jgi:hypothetical protein
MRSIGSGNEICVLFLSILVVKTSFKPILAQPNPWPGGWSKDDDDDDEEEDEEEEDDQSSAKTNADATQPNSNVTTTNSTVPVIPTPTKVSTDEEDNEDEDITAEDDSLERSLEVRERSSVQRKHYSSDRHREQLNKGDALTPEERLLLCKQIEYEK